MSHEEHTAPTAPGFGTNTGGTGILIVVLLAVGLALFCWYFWKDAKKESDLYRYKTETKAEEKATESHH